MVESVKKRVTLKEIAGRVGVSKNTISLALRANPRISSSLREKIRRIADKMGYVADPILQRLAEYRRADSTKEFHGLIAWLNHWPVAEQLRSYHEFDQYWRGARMATKRLGYRLEEFIWPPHMPAQQAEKKLNQRGVLGLLIPPHKPDVEWGNFDWNKFSLIRFGMSVSRVDANLVTADHLRAMVMAVGKIHDCGYRRIGLVFDAAHDRSMGGSLFGGFQWAGEMLKLQQKIPPLDFNVQGSAVRGKKNLELWMKKHLPNAILTTAPQIPVFLRELGYRIPGDVAVASTSPYDIAVDAGIDQCPHTIGQIAAELLIKQISLNERGEPADPCRILIKSHWQDGKSLPSR